MANQHDQLSLVSATGNAKGRVTNRMGPGIRKTETTDWKAQLTTEMVEAQRREMIGDNSMQPIRQLEEQISDLQTENEELSQTLAELRVAKLAS